MTTKRDQPISRIKINLETGEVTITVNDHLQQQVKIHLSQISADKSYPTRLFFQFLTGLEIKTRATIYPTERNSQLPTTVNNQKGFDLLQQTMKLMSYRDYAL